MCIVNEYVDRYPDGSRVEFSELSRCKYARPGHPCSTLRTIENPIRKIDFGEPTTQHLRSRQPYGPTSPPRTSSSGSPRTRRLSGQGELPDEGTLRRRDTISRNDQVTGERTHRRERREPQERIILVDGPPAPVTPAKLYNISPSPTSPEHPAYYARGRPIIVDERHRQRMLRTPTPHSYGDEGRRNPDRSASYPESRDRGRRGYERTPVLLSDDRYQWSSPPRIHDTFHDHEVRGRRASFSDRESRRGSYSDQRRDARLSFSDPERRERRGRRSSYSDQEREHRRERRGRRESYSDPEKEERRARRERRVSIPDPGKEERRERRERRATFTAHERKEKRPSFSDPEKPSRDEIKGTYSDPGRQTSEERDREERRRRRYVRENRAYHDAERRKAAFIAAQDDEIRRRPPKPAVWPKPILRQRRTDPNHPPKAVTIDDKNIVDASAALERRQEDRKRVYRQRLEELDREAQKRRLKERLQPTRRASVGPGYRRHRVLYDDGMYCYE